MKTVLISTISVAALAVAGHASATFIMDFPPEGCAPSQGCLHFDKDAKDVTTTTGTVKNTTEKVTITTNVNIDIGQGYATIKPDKFDTTPLTSLTFTPANDLAFNDFSVRGQVMNASDFVVITVTDQNGSSQTFDFSVTKPNDDIGRIGVVSTDTETIKSITLSDAGGFEEVKQVDFSPAVAPVVPEPATWALMLIGLGAMGGVLRRRARASVSVA